MTEGSESAEENTEMQAEAKRREALLFQAREESTSPGVYLMKDEAGKILYIGKAKNLRKRVTTYFKPLRHDSARTELMVSRVQNFEVILTETEAEALILECTLIKKHKPKFNVMLKDDKTYPYIRIQTADSFPRLEYTRRVTKDGSRYFGPFPSAWAARQIVRLLTETLQLRDCSDNTFRHRSRPCILYQMEKCTAPCVGEISQIDYAEQIQEAIQILEGKSSRMTDELKLRMNQAAENLEYEMAAYYRDQLGHLELVTETQGVVEPGAETSRDIAGMAREGTDAYGALLQIRGGKLIAVKHYHLQNTEPELEDAEIYTHLLAQHYMNAKKDGQIVYASHPKEVLLSVAPNDVEILEKVFQVTVRVFENETEKQLVNVAAANAKHSLEMKHKRAAGHGVGALEEIQKKLHLEKLPIRIECYDISNIQGEKAVASRVVFVNGAPDKNLYRRYKIRSVEGANDFAMMREVLDRRFSRVDDPFPELVVVDGGKGQLSQAVAILEELSIQGVAVVGLAKARTEKNFQAKEVKSSLERIFIPGRKNPVPLYPTSDAYKLLVHIRDEAHRFAVNYHRLLRDKLPQSD